MRDGLEFVRDIGRSFAMDHLITLVIEVGPQGKIIARERFLPIRKPFIELLLVLLLPPLGLQHQDDALCSR
jgi:hypothetical protein